MRTLPLRQAVAELIPDLIVPSSWSDQQLLAVVRHVLETGQLDDDERAAAAYIDGNAETHRLEAFRQVVRDDAGHIIGLMGERPTSVVERA